MNQFFSTNIQNFVLACLLVLLTGSVSFASSGIYQTYAIVDRGSGNEYYSGGINSQGGTAFNGLNLGSFCPTATLKLNGGEVLTYKNSGSDVYGANINYRIYPTSGSPGSFIQISLPFTCEWFNNPIPCAGTFGSGDQKWSRTAHNVDVLAGLTAGTYYLEVYWDAPSSDGTHYDTNFGANFKATFTVLAPSLSATVTNVTCFGQSNGAIDLSLSCASSIPSVSQVYTQDFNTLANSPTSTNITWTDNSTIPNWYTNRTMYRVSTGTDNTGSVYSFGSASAADRALGSVASGSTGTILGAVKITNTTGQTVTNITVSYTGEQWRNGGNTTSHRLDFSYAINATDEATGTYTDVNSLDFTGPIATATAGALDGNASANRLAISASFTVSLPNGSSIWLRWQDADDTGSDHGLAIDDLTATLTNTGGGILYSWSNGATTEDISGLAAGNYTVTVTAGNGTASASYSVTQPPAVVASASSNSPICDGSVLNLFAGGGNSYSWVGPNGFSSGDQNPSITSATTAASGTYTVTVTDANSCTGTATTDVTVNQQATVGTASASPDFVCPVGSSTISLSSSNGNVMWQQSSNGIDWVNIPICNELYMSEYVEGSGFVKAIEIFNGTGAAIDLAAGAYKLDQYTNGSPTVSKSTSLSGILAAGDVYIVADPAAPAEVLALADLVFTANNFNGDDAVALVHNSTIIDVLGQIGVDPGSAWTGGGISTLNQTLRRKPALRCAGDANGADAFDPSIEWDGYIADDISGLGSHSIDYADLYTGALSSTTYYQAVASLGSCPDAVSNSVMVEVGSAPSIDVCPSVGTIYLSAGQCNANVSYADAVVSGNPAPSVTYSHPSGSSFPIGTTTVTVTATSTCGTVECTFDVVVVNNTAEICNGIDDDCDGTADDGLTFITYYADADGDGYGDENDPGVSLCADPGAGYSTSNDDCNDGNGSINPAATEICNGIDDDCDGQTDETTLSAVCSITNAAIYYGYSLDQTSTVNVAVSGGTGPYTVSITMDRIKKCNVVTDAGDETWTGLFGSTSGASCPAYPAAGSTIPVTSGTGLSAGTYGVTVSLMDTATFTVTVTDANGCVRTCTIGIHAEDVRCFAGNSGITKIKICHKTGSNKNPCVTICVDESALTDHFAHLDVLNACPKTGCGGKEEEMHQAEPAIFLVYPNPSNGMFNIDFAGEYAPLQLMITNLLGQVVYSETLDQFDGVMQRELDLNQLADGSYYVNIINGDHRYTKQLVVTH
jgi:hypothetical protein